MHVQLVRLEEGDLHPDLRILRLTLRQGPERGHHLAAQPGAKMLDRIADRSPSGLGPPTQATPGRPANPLNSAPREAAPCPLSEAPSGRA